ncbi:ISMsm6, transposase [Mobiluncus mulieris 28-1]|nr:hypothetical protein [Mobiluncus mulieris]EEZ90853.1 ISMsm6, transposase [Mobiluncus mulieris 28-1]
MSPFLRKVRTASGAVAVQIVEKQGRVNRVLKHLGSAHDEAKLAVLLEIGRKELRPGQLEFDFNSLDTGSCSTPKSAASVISTTVGGAPGGVSGCWVRPGYRR